MLVAVLGTLGIVAIFVAVGLWVDRRVSLLPRAEDLDEASRPRPLGGEHEAGTAPQSALRSDPTRMQRVLAGQRCTCTARSALAAAGDEDVRYGDKTLRVFRLACPTCGATRSLYFEPRAS